MIPPWDLFSHNMGLISRLSWMHNPEAQGVLMGPPETSGAQEPPVPEMSCETHLVSSEHPLGVLVRGANLVMPLAWTSRSRFHSPSHTAAFSGHFQLRLPARRLCFRICSRGSRLREVPTQHETFPCLPALNLDGFAIACWQSSVLPSGPCNKNRLGRG